MTNYHEAGFDRPSAPATLPHLDSPPIQILIPSTGKKVLGFLLDESADRGTVQVRRTRCLAAGDQIQLVRNGHKQAAVVKQLQTNGIGTRIGLAWPG